MHTICSPYGTVLRIVIFKNGVQAMVEYPWPAYCSVCTTTLAFLQLYIEPIQAYFYAPGGRDPKYLNSTLASVYPVTYMRFL